MRVLQLIQRPQKRGAETFALQLAGQLRALGDRVFVASLFPGPLQTDGQEDFIRLDRPASKRFFDWVGFHEIARIVEREKIDIVQANAGDTLKYAVLSRVFFGWKARIVFRNASTVSQYIRNPISRFYNRWLYRHTDYIISVAGFTRADLLGLFPEVAGKIAVVPIGIEGGAIEPGPKAYDVIHVGGFTFEKNHRRLVTIFDRVRQLQPTAQLVLAGDGPLRAETEALVDAQGLRAVIRFAGVVSDPLAAICAARVLVLPSILEGLPGVILEAFYCRVPVVAYQAGGIAEIVRDGVTGRLIAQGDEAAFAAAVADILRTPEAYAAQVENAYTLVRDEYMNTVLAGRFREIYSGLLTA